VHNKVRQVLGPHYWDPKGVKDRFFSLYRKASVNNAD